MALPRITCNKRDFRTNILIFHLISTGHFLVYLE